MINLHSALLNPWCELNSIDISCDRFGAMQLGIPNAVIRQVVLEAQDRQRGSPKGGARPE